MDKGINRVVSGQSPRVSNRENILLWNSDVEIHSFVAHAEAIKYMKSSSVLLLIIPNIEGNKGNLTGKLFEYIGSRTPILCLGPTDGDAAAIIQVCKAGKTFKYDDEEGMFHFLTSLLDNFNPQSPVKENDAVHRYSRKSLTRSLTQILAHHED